MVNVNGVVRREFPNWNQRGRIRKVDEHGNVLEGQYAFGGEFVRVSPRFQKNGANYRVRPERPAYFFSQFCVEHGLLPTALTPEECASEPGLAILQSLWEAYKSYFPKLESPYAACDHATQPSLQTGYSFCMLQVLVELVGVVRNTASPALARPTPNGSVDGSAMLKMIEAMRARSAAAKPDPMAAAKKRA